jgi:NADH:ubiquinone oxidoreductase subunit E
MGNCSNGPNLKIDGIIREGVTIAETGGLLERELAKLK